MTPQQQKDKRLPMVVRCFQMWHEAAGFNEALDWLLRHVDAQDRKLDELKQRVANLQGVMKRDRKRRAQ